MSIEQFHEGYPADETFVRDMSRRREFDSTSPVRLLAGIYISEGSSGLSQIVYDRAHRLDAGVKKIVKEEDLSMIKNTSSIYLGNTLLAIDSLIFEGYLDQVRFNSVLANSFTGSGINPPKVFPNPEPEEISEENLKNITDAAIEDKSLAPFFRENYFILPASLRGVLANSNIIEYIRRFILQDYEDRARKLLAEKERIKATS